MTNAQRSGLILHVSVVSLLTVLWSNCRCRPCPFTSPRTFIPARDFVRISARHSSQKQTNNKNKTKQILHMKQTGTCVKVTEEKPSVEKTGAAHYFEAQPHLFNKGLLLLGPRGCQQNRHSGRYWWYSWWMKQRMQGCCTVHRSLWFAQIEPMHQKAVSYCTARVTWSLSSHLQAPADFPESMKVLAASYLLPPSRQNSWLNASYEFAVLNFRLGKHAGHKICSHRVHCPSAAAEFGRVRKLHDTMRLHEKTLVHFQIPVSSAARAHRAESNYPLIRVVVVDLTKLK